MLSAAFQCIPDLLAPTVFYAFIQTTRRLTAVKKNERDSSGLFYNITNLLAMIAYLRQEQRRRHKAQAQLKDEIQCVANMFKGSEVTPRGRRLTDL